MQSMLRAVFRTENQLTMAISGTGSAGQEATVLNLVEPGDKVLVCVNGVFGMRLADMAERAGGEVTKIERPWGEVFTVGRSERSARQSEAEGRRHRHGRNLDRRLAADRRNRRRGPRCRRDADPRHGDRARRHSGRNRQVENRRRLLRHAEVPRLPAGTRAGLVQQAGRRKNPRPQGKGAQLVSRRLADRQLLGRRPRLSSHRADQHDLRAARSAAASSSKKASKRPSPAIAKTTKRSRPASPRSASATPPQEGHQLPQLNAVRIPEGVDDAAVRKGLLERFGIEIGAGLGAFKGKVWRIGLMGYSSRPGERPAVARARSNNFWPSKSTVQTRREHRRGERQRTPNEQARE